MCVINVRSLVSSIYSHCWSQPQETWVRDWTSKDKQRQQESIARKQQRMKQHFATQGIKETSRIFISTVKEGPDYICTCCNHLMYWKSFTNYTKAPAEFATMSVYHQASADLFHCDSSFPGLQSQRHGFICDWRPGSEANWHWPIWFSACKQLPNNNEVSCPHTQSTLATSKLI